VVNITRKSFLEFFHASQKSLNDIRLHIEAHITADNAQKGISWNVVVNAPRTTTTVNIVVALDIGVLAPEASLREERE
jgi:hypothetical protein